MCFVYLLYIEKQNVEKCAHTHTTDISFHTARMASSIDAMVIMWLGYVARIVILVFINIYR